MVEITNAKTKDEKIAVLIALKFNQSQAEIIASGGTPLIGDVVVVGDTDEQPPESYVIDLDEP